MPPLPWTKTFLDHCARSSVQPTTMRIYSFLVQSITNHYGLDLQTCTETQLLTTMDNIRTRTKPSSYSLYAGTSRRILRFLDRKDLADKIPMVRKPDRATQIKDQLLSPNEVESLIRGARNRVQRLLVELLFETGARCGEIANLRIRDIQFDEFSAIVALTGKTGTRKRRVFDAVPDLRAHLNDHPQKDNPDAPLFLTQHGTRFGYSAIYDLIRTLGSKILKKDIHPHQLRHSKATQDSKFFTDREMMELYGWKSPIMVGTYSHLSMRDVDDKDLVLHGLKPREEVLRPLVHAQHCPTCKEANAPFSIYCVKCGHVLGTGDTDIGAALQDSKFIKSLASNAEFIEALRKALKD